MCQENGHSEIPKKKEKRKKNPNDPAGFLIQLNFWKDNHVGGGRESDDVRCVDWGEGEGGEADDGGHNETLDDEEHGKHCSRGRGDGPGAGDDIPTGSTARGPAGWRGRARGSGAGISRAASGYTGPGTGGTAGGRRADRAVAG